MARGWGGEKGAQVNGLISPRTDAPFSQRQKGALTVYTGGSVSLGWKCEDLLSGGCELSAGHVGLCWV